MKHIFAALLLATPVAAQDAATVTVQTPPAQVHVDVSDNDTTIVQISVEAAQASLDAAVAQDTGINWFRGAERLAWLGVAIWAVYEFKKKDFSDTQTVGGVTVTSGSGTATSSTDGGHHPPGEHKGWHK